MKLPTTMPSSTAARVALRASVIRSLISPTSTSEPPPTLMTPTPPCNLARRSESFSLSYSLVESLCYSLICSHRSLIAYLDPYPCMMIVSSLVTSTFLHCPSTVDSAFSSVSPISSVTTVPPVRIAMSLRIAFLLS